MKTTVKSATKTSAALRRRLPRLFESRRGPASGRSRLATEARLSHEPYEPGQKALTYGGEAWVPDEMSETNRFQERLDEMNKAWRGPEHTAEAAQYVRDTIELAWCAAVDLFGRDASADVTLQIYDRIDSERLRRAHEDERHRAELGPSSRA